MLQSNVCFTKSQSRNVRVKVGLRQIHVVRNTLQAGASEGDWEQTSVCLEQISVLGTNVCMKTESYRISKLPDPSHMAWRQQLALPRLAALALFWRRFTGCCRHVLSVVCHSHVPLPVIQPRGGKNAPAFTQTQMINVHQHAASSNAITIHHSGAEVFARRASDIHHLGGEICTWCLSVRDGIGVVIRSQGATAPHPRDKKDSVSLCACVRY